MSGIDWDSQGLHHPPHASDGLDPPYSRCGYNRKNANGITYVCPKTAVYIWYENNLRFLACEDHMDSEAIKRSDGKYTRLV